MKYPAHANQKSFRIFLGVSAAGILALLVPLYILGGTLPRFDPAAFSFSRPASPSPSPAEAKPGRPAEPVAVAAPPPPPPAAAVYTVEVYDPSRDPAKDLAKTLERARAENKRVLLLVGGAWCLWSRALDVYIHENEETAAALGRDYLIMKVNYSPANENRIFTGGFEEIEAIPHFFVLDSEGKLIHSQLTGPLEKGLAYDTATMLAFLEKWAPGADAAEPGEDGENAP